LTRLLRIVGALLRPRPQAKEIGSEAARLALPAHGPFGSAQDALRPRYTCWERSNRRLKPAASGGGRLLRVEAWLVCCPLAGLRVCSGEDWLTGASHDLTDGLGAIPV